MRIGLDATAFYLGLTSGIPYQMYQLVRALQRRDEDLELHLFMRGVGWGESRPVLEDLQGPHTRIVPAVLRSGERRQWGRWAASYVCADRYLGDLDVFHAVDGLRPRSRTVPTVVSIMDLTTFLFPETHSWLNRLVHRMKLGWARRHAERVIAISEATRRDVLEAGGFVSGEVDVVPLGCGIDRSLLTSRDDSAVQEARERHGLDGGRYVLSVGTIEPRKNQVRLLRAFLDLPERFGDVTLVFAGRPGWRTTAIEREFERAEATGRVRVLGFVEDSDLAALYRGADLLAYPSLYEGFGHPLLEAMVAGTAVLTSDVSSMPEVVGGAGELVDPESVPSIRAGLERVLGDDAYRRTLEERGRERAKRFSWDRTAELTLETYRRAIASGP